MDGIILVVSQKLMDFYYRPRKEGGAGFKNKADIIKYLNLTGHYMKEVVDIKVDARITAALKPLIENEESD